ncbi:RraA-like protein [Basidiobolus meristosporus CBS 931.73]|uniref:RraA-like protein n=1 Tax=Basidiobolus meristosporus CBS 931.73 TaxID=1314790 RepID=A0A1Y1Z7V6_9FUNG|nr:RraA-like protein [Basidiobolus meristosporus CBS 931.73]|eukprot:ORY06352.1 RraA-like protein [Basidiobolus meristosporus CBS 931.73]
MDVHNSLLKLENYGSCEVGDALTKLNTPCFLPDLCLYSPEYLSGETKVIGPAYTVQMVSVKDTQAPPTPQEHFVDTAPEGSVVVISAPAGAINAVWGGLMTTRAKHLGVKGVVIDGRFRDLEEQREMNFPIFARGLSCLGAGGFTRCGGVRVPVKIGAGESAVTVQSSDIIVADLNGVVVIPLEKLEEVIEICAISSVVDAKCMADLKSGKDIRSTFKLHRG